MRKFSKLIESVKYTEEDIEDLFLPLLDQGAKIKIYDGYFETGSPETETHGRGHDNFHQSLSSINDYCHDAKLVIVSLPIKVNSVSVEPWREIQHNSGFYFQSKENFIKYRQVINELYGCLSHIKYDYIIELEQDRIKLILIGELVEETTTSLSNKNKEMYEYLCDELLKITDIFVKGSYSTQANKWNISYDTQFYPLLRISYKQDNKKLRNALSSITRFNPIYDNYFVSLLRNLPTNILIFL